MYGFLPEELNAKARFTSTGLAEADAADQLTSFIAFIWKSHGMCYIFQWTHFYYRTTYRIRGRVRWRPSPGVVLCESQKIRLVSSVPTFFC